ADDRRRHCGDLQPVQPRKLRVVYDAGGERALRQALVKSGRRVSTEDGAVGIPSDFLNRRPQRAQRLRDASRTIRTTRTTRTIRVYIRSSRRMISAPLTSARSLPK